MHVRVWIKLDKKELFFTFVYARNSYIQRRSLWENLCVHKHYVRARPWCILGDFNATLYLEDSTAGSSRFDISMREFKECVKEIEVLDVVSTRLQFTWNQKPKGNYGILKKIDRIMANLDFNDMFIGAHAIFMPYKISDHAPAVLKIPLLAKIDQRPFKLTNLLVHNSSFKNIVKEGWSKQGSGFYMFQVVKKLKLLKKPLCKLLFAHGNVHDNVKRL
ncbi:RNA-directed DNA polymerase, eukaryota, reverse transcriptase zinc-binding domain protein [Tanacetum coccineum]